MMFRRTTTPPVYQLESTVYKNHSQFWFRDGTAIITVGKSDVQYKVHISILGAQSPIFRDMFRDAVSLEDRFYLDTIKREDFEELLAFLYPTDYSLRERMSGLQWKRILRVTTELDMESIRMLAVGKLNESARRMKRMVFGDGAGYQQRTEGHSLIPMEGRSMSDVRRDFELAFSAPAKPLMSMRPWDVDGNR